MRLIPRLESDCEPSKSNTSRFYRGFRTPSLGGIQAPENLDIEVLGP